MPIEENFEFESAKYRREVEGFSPAKLKQQETAMARKCLSSGFATSFGVGSAFFSGGLTLLLAGYKSRSTYVAYKKREIIQGELRKRHLGTRRISAKDAAIAWSIGAIAAIVGVEIGDFTEGVTNIEGMGAGLPPNANDSTGLTTDPGTAAKGMADQFQQLAAHAMGENPANVAAQVAAADATAYHAGMIQAKIIEEHLGNEATEAALVAFTSPPEEAESGCSRAKVPRLNCDRCKELIGPGHCYWHCCKCDNDDYDICLECKTKNLGCKNRNHPLRKLQIPT
ncbi:hypothetical protein F5Y11DRAFT_273241 [Daldinia sp. FL1419]|nr:hypothetical protein F5Y11DRAFT_273241 [Daldinia sp. FL1419]